MTPPSAVGGRFVARRRELPPPSSAGNVATSADAPPADAPAKRRQGSGPRLTDATRLEILALLAAPTPPPLRQLARQFGVSEATIRHVRDRAAVITSRALAAPEHVRQRTRRAAQRTFPELEARLGAWLDACGSTSSADDVNNSVMRRAEEIAAQLGLRDHEFRASASWLKGFQRRRATGTGLCGAPLALAPPAMTEAATSELQQEAASATTGEKRKRGAGPRLSDGQRLEIIHQLQRANGPSNRKLAAEYSVDEATIRHVKANAEAIQTRALNAPIDVRQTTYRVGKAKFAELETILGKWIDESRRCNAEIPPVVVRRKAEEVALELEIPEGEFKASVSWYASFCRRQGLGPVSPINDLEQIVAAYEPKDVFTVDETGLFFRLLPRHDTLVPSTDPSKSLERVTLVLCCNATGAERLPVSVISKDAAPRCKAPSSDWPLPYFHQSNAWMDTKVFAKWFDEVFARHVGKDRKVLLLLDNAPGHPVSFENGNIRVLALHPASKSWVPPLTRGVITGLKNRYKLRVLSDILAHHALSADMKRQLALGSKRAGKGPAGVFFGQMPHLLDAAHRIVDAWTEISSELIRFSFEEAGFVMQLRAGDDQHAMRIEAQELKVEDDMLKMLERFCRGHESFEMDDSSLAGELQTYLHLDDEHAPVYQKCIEDDIDGMLAEAESNTAARSNDEAGDEELQEVTESTGSTRNRILMNNGTLSPTADATVTTLDVLTTSTLLGMQLRQLQPSNEFDTQQIERAVLMVDRLRRELQAPGPSPSTATSCGPASAATDDSGN